MLQQQQRDLCRQLAARENLQSAFPARQPPSYLPGVIHFSLCCPESPIFPATSLLEPSPLQFELLFPPAYLLGLPSAHAACHPSTHVSTWRKKENEEMSLDGENPVHLVPKKRIYSFIFFWSARLLPSACLPLHTLRQSVTHPNMCGCCSTRGGQGARQWESDNVWFFCPGKKKIWLVMSGFAFLPLRNQCC